MKASILFHCAASVALAAAVLTLPAAFGAQTTTPQDLAGMTQAGSYLAARHATAERDSLAAAAYFRSVLKSDPKNSELLEHTFFSLIASGEIEDAVKIAERIVQVDHNNRSARLLLGVRAIKHKQYQAARTQLSQSVHGPVTDLTATLLNAWAMAGNNETRAAIETIDHLSGPDWYAVFKDLHAGLILDLAGNKKEAGKRFERAYKLDATALRLVQAYGSWASRNSGKQAALKIYRAFDAVLPRHPLVLEAQQKVEHGERVPRLVQSPQAGAAEVLYGLGASLGRRGGEDLGIMYLQLALYLEPQHPMALLSLADLYETMKKPDLAINIYRRLPESSPLKRNADIQLALNLDSLNKTGEAEEHLNKLIAAHSDDLEAIMALGNILRGRKKFAECADAYSKAIALNPKPQKSDWTVYYFRGICYERSKQWPKAEADLKKALELYPDQPHVLNYLGYSWIDQGVHLEEGMRMIRRAVEQRPDDGYIVDSLGWAYFRTGDYDNAVKQLDRAVELKPEDPTINDHLGDAYWKVGRELEAKFQWSQARDLKPDPDELAKIEAKLKSGLTEATSSAADAGKAKKPGNGG